METIVSSSFRIIRLLGNDLVPSDCTIEITIELEPSVEDDDLQENSLKAIKFWIENFLDTSVVYFPGTTINIKLLEEISNNVIITPEEPNDYHLCILLHSKLNAVGCGAVKVSKTKLYTDTGEGFSCIFSGGTDEWLPNNKDWMGTKTFFDKPWWARSDASTMDMPYEDGDDIESVKKSIVVNLIDIVNAKSKDSPVQYAEIIKPAFNLKLIDNDE